MQTFRMRKSLLSCMLLLMLPVGVCAQGDKGLQVNSSDNANAFALFTPTGAASIQWDSADAKVVGIAADALAGDLALLRNQDKNKINQTPSINTIIVGTIGHSKFVDAVIQNKQLDVSTIKNKWECFIIKVINNHTLVIAGSDRRGTAFGVFHLSRAMGVSPWVWWADVLPEKKTELYVSGRYVSKEPSVQYRGIFINDEDWGMQPWAAKKMDTDIKDIGPKTYARIFELLLRLKANYIWPAMHPCTKAFYYYKQNPKVADDYAIVVGGSHCEPMLRNNVCEWAETYEEEYKKKPGEWRYDVNHDEIYTYWNDRIKESVNYESVYTVGMRGVHDGSMPGPKDPDEKVKLLEKVITDQRQILQNNFNKNPNLLPQIFVPYKEVLSLYRRGLQLPDDITIIWPDDNYGYIRQLPDDAEQKRSGGNGVYYHVSYWGSPADYLWLCTTSPALIGYEMKKAWNYNAKKLWVFNVGDLKPAELETQFAMDMAYDINIYEAAEPMRYVSQFMVENFGITNGAALANIKAKYYLLSQSGKPEHLNHLHFTPKEINERLELCTELEAAVDEVSGRIDPRLTDAFYELVKYPTEAAVLQNRKILYQQLAANAQAQQNVAEVQMDMQLSKQAYDIIGAMTEHYNRFIAAGKWNGMMSMHPRDQKVFAAPPPADSIKTDSVQMDRIAHEAQRVQIITAAPLFGKGGRGCDLLPGIGVGTAAITPKPGATKAVVQYPLNLHAGLYAVEVKCLPTFAMEKERILSYTVTLGNGDTQTADVNAEAESSAWKENVLRGYSLGKTIHTVKADGNTTLTIELHNKNLVISSVEVYKLL
ncbi:MAG: glycosyl hydrolase 115 family protein [Bacteroidetes bacterium]|nr:glycosyl hydrolase 115 family protein [Bacteroidota bacterium]